VALTACSVPAVTFTPSEQGVTDGGVETDATQRGPALATITVSRAGAATGTVSVQGLPISCGEDCTATVAVGTAVTLVATPDPGGVFGGWSGDGCGGSDATCAITVTADVAIAARFDVAMFTIDLALIGSGTGLVMSNAGLMCPGMCTGTFPYNTAIELTAAPGAASTFTGWSGPCSGTGTCSFTVTAATAVTAGFALNNELIVTRTGNGSGTVSSTPAGILCGPDCTQRYSPGASVTLAATADADSVFTGWSGQGCTGTGTCQLTINQAAMVTATFALRQFVLQVVRAGGGSGTVSSNPAGISCAPDCNEAYDAHTMVTLTASPAANSVFVGWSNGSCSGTGTCTLTMDAAASVTATFALQRFVLTVTTVGGGLVQSSPAGISCGADCSEIFDAGTMVTLTATPASGSTFAGWSGACTGLGACPVQMTSSASVTATFAPRGGLYMINQNTARLERMDPVTLVGTDVGPLGAAFSLGDCAWNPADARLYMVDGTTSPGSLYRVDLATGAASLVGVHGISNMLALAYHPPSNQLYGVATDGANNLYTINPATGAATRIGPTGVQQVEGLAWDSRRNVMVALSAVTGAIYSVNLATAAATQLQPATISNLGLTYDPVLDRFWAGDNSSSIYQFDPNASFARTVVTSFSTGHTCIAFVPTAP
jgi:Divergent InlB B-repeat domain